MTTVKDIAKAAGVSPSSVSYVLNNRTGEVSAETRTRVLKVVRELGYRPTPLSPKARVVRTNTIGLVMMHASVNTLRNGGFFPQVLDGILTSAMAHQMATTIYLIEQWDDVQATVRKRFDGRCDGMLFIGPSTENEIVPALWERGSPVVLISGESSIPGITSVDVDNRRAAKQAVEHLISLGHRRIAHLSATSIYAPFVRRAEGYRAALAEAGIPFDPRLEPDNQIWIETGVRSAIELMQMPLEDRPTAIFCGFDDQAAAVIRALTDLGFRVPEDVSVMGFDDADSVRGIDPPLSTIRQPFTEFGIRAMEVLLDMISSSSREDHSEVLKHELVIRQSTGPVPG